ncbi:MAG: CMP deaminase [Hyphomicrobiales bacterium]|nr:MAG: CMP deaminase [Hyphomicrobiales bacterium]
MTHDKWDIRFLDLAKHISLWSKDPSTKIGAVIVDDERHILSTGYNGFPKGVRDKPQRLENREEKYKFVVHAEMNCIYNASLHGISLKNSTLYIHGLPACHECAKGIIQAGIKRVVMSTLNDNISEKWADSYAISATMFREADVRISFI